MYPKWSYKEHEMFKRYYDCKIPDEDAKIVVDKLSRHFKLINSYTGIVHLKFHGGKQSGRAWPSTKQVCLSHGPSLGLIAHELTHLFDGNIHHGSKKWNRTMWRVINYADKKHWWREEIAKRTTAKITIIPVLSKNDIREQKIKKAQEKIVRYEKKMRFYKNKLSKAQRSLSMLERLKRKEQEVKP